jgi:hypothetical protein
VGGGTNVTVAHRLGRWGYNFSGKSFISVESFVFQKRKWKPLYLLSTWRQDTPESSGFARQPKASFYFQRQGIFLTL